MNDVLLLERLTREWAEHILRQDVAGVGRLLAPNFCAALAVEGTPTLSISRDLFLSNVLAYRMADLLLEDIQARVLGQVGIVTFYWTTRSYEWHGEAGENRRYFNTDVWTNDTGEWLMASHHSSRALPGPAPSKGMSEG